MAITVKYNPDNWQPVFNPIVWVVESTNVTECEFRFLADVYIGGTFITRLKTFPNADGFGIFKVQDILASYLSEEVPDIANLWTDLDSHWKSLQLKFGEEYDNSVGCDAGTTVYADLTLSSLQYGFLGGLSFQAFRHWVATDYQTGSSTRLLNTNLPRTSKVLRDGVQYLTSAYLSNNTARMQIKTYDSANSLIGTYTTDNPYTSSNRLVSVAVGGYHLNSYTLVSGSQPIIDDSVVKYTVQFTTTGGAAQSETFTFLIDDRCTKYEGAQLMFLNRLGGWDVAYFTGGEETKVNVQERKQYNRIAGSYTDASPTGDWDYTASERGVATYAVNARESATYYSNWVNEDEANWLRELFTSPAVYRLNSYTYNSTEYTFFEPVNVTSNEYTKLVNRNKKMKQYVLNVELSQGETIQRL
jgi:hypothetical protein